jgi:hypothetical protein
MLDVEIVPANDIIQMITTPPVSVALIAIVTNADNESVPGQRVRWRLALPLPPNSTPQLVGVVEPDITDDCGVSHIVYLQWTGGVPGESVTVVAEALDDNERVIGSDSYTNTLIAKNCPTNANLQTWANIEQLLGPIHCNITYANATSHMIEQVEQAVNNWNNASNPTHIKLVPANPGGIITVEEYCDPESLSVAKTCADGQGVADGCPRNVPVGQIVIFLNQYFLYGHCDDDPECPYDYPPDNPANVSTITHEFGHALGIFSDPDAKGIVMHKDARRWYECGVDAPKSTDIMKINSLYPA